MKAITVVSWLTLSLGLALTLLLGACASHVRYADRKPLWEDPDVDPIPVPKKRTVYALWLRVKADVFTPIDAASELTRKDEARNVNALDEVPDSSWYADPRRAAERAGRAFGPAEVAATPEPLDETGVLTILEGREAGGSHGFVITDARGKRYLLKLDVPGYFSLTTSTEVVCARLVAAAGWRVPSLSLVDVRADQLVISPNASISAGDDGRRAFTTQDLERFLKDAPRTTDGRYRFSASAWIEGRVVGPYSYVGRRQDDPNDRVVHQNRRDLRGYVVLSSWINNVDTIESNTLDTYVGLRGRGHLIHYQQDVGGSFGNYAVSPLASWMGYESYFDGARILRSIVSLGAYTRAWQRDEIEYERDRTVRQWPELGWFEADHFDPKTWSPLWPNQAFSRATARDLYWGVKRVLAFSAQEIKAAIAVGRYRPLVAERLFDVLWARRDKLARAYLPLVAPFERVQFEHDDLCFDDLMVQHGFDARPATYDVRGAGAVVMKDAGRRCTRVPHGAGYHIVAVRVRRADERKFGAFLRVHYVEEGNTRRVIGLER